MSKAKFYPLYVVHMPPLGSGCGHQHATENQARHCAAGIMQKYPAMPHVTVMKLRRNAVTLAVIETVIDTIKRSVFTKEQNEKHSLTTTK